MNHPRLVGCGVTGLLLTGGLAMAARRHLVAVKINGRSMSPTYEPGDRVLVLRRALSGLTRGGVVVVEGPVDPDRPGWEGLPPFDGRIAGRNWFIKRVAALPGDPIPEQVLPAVGATAGGRVPAGRLVLLGDNEQSVDSRTLGYFPGERVLGQVLRRLPRAAAG